MRPDLSVPKIVIDARMIGAVPHGIARYVKNLAFGLEQLPVLRYEPLFLVSAEGKSQIPAKFETVELNAPFLSARELVEIPLALRKISPALYHSPSFSSLVHSPCPWIVTIHDLNHLHFGGIKERIYYRTILRGFARGAKRVLTVSEFSQREIAEWLDRPASGIEIVYNALDPAFARPTRDVPESVRAFNVREGEYFLFISHHSKAHKNSQIILQAYAEAKKRDSRIAPLVLNASPEELSRESRELPGVIPAGKISDPELRLLISNSRSVLFPSLYEGFGLPPLEAAILGARVLVSDIPPHREALVDFSEPQIRWIDPKDAHSWMTAFLKSSSLERPVPATLSERISRASARFSVRTLAEHMDLLYRSVLELA